MNSIALNQAWHAKFLGNPLSGLTFSKIGDIRM